MKRTSIVLSLILAFFFVFTACDPSTLEKYGIDKEDVDKLKKLTIVYDLNGGEGTVPESQTIDFNDDGESKDYFRAQEFGDVKRDGYFISGWNTKADGSGKNFHPSTGWKVKWDTFTIGSDGTAKLYANWLEVTEKNGVLYSLKDDGTYAVAALTESNNAETITIPEEVDGKQVTGILEKAFMDREFKSMTLPDSITEIGSFAFDRCVNLETVNIPTGLTELDSQLFWYCKKLDNVIVPSNVKVIWNQAFYGCNGLKNITISEGVERLGGSVFQNCSGLESITIPSTVTAISSNCFNGCTKLTTINIDKDRDTIKGAPWGAENAVVKWKNETVGEFKEDTAKEIVEKNVDIKSLINEVGSQADLYKTKAVKSVALDFTATIKSTAGVSFATADEHKALKGDEGYESYDGIPKAYSGFSFRYKAAGTEGGAERWTYDSGNYIKYTVVGDETNYDLLPLNRSAGNYLLCDLDAMWKAVEPDGTIKTSMKDFIDRVYSIASAGAVIKGTITLDDFKIEVGAELTADTATRNIVLEVKSLKVTKGVVTVLSGSFKLTLNLSSDVDIEFRISEEKKNPYNFKKGKIGVTLSDVNLSVYTGTTIKCDSITASVEFEGNEPVSITMSVTNLNETIGTYTVELDSASVVFDKEILRTSYPTADEFASCFTIGTFMINNTVYTPESVKTYIGTALAKSIESRKSTE